MNKWKKYATKKQRVEFYWKSLTTEERISKLKEVTGLLVPFNVIYSMKEKVYEANNKLG